MEYWIQLLGELEDEGEFDGGLLEKAIVQLCVMEIIQVRLLLMRLHMDVFFFFS